MTVKDRLKEWVDALSEEEAMLYLRRLEEDQADLEAYRQGLKDAEENGTIPWKQAKQQLGLS